MSFWRNLLSGRNAVPTVEERGTRVGSRLPMTRERARRLVAVYLLGTYFSG
jgi:hypothetical protein